VKRALFALLAMTVAVALSLMAAELVVRTWYPQKLSLNVTRWDPDVGFSNLPGITGYGETAEYRMRMQINSRGLRDREFTLTKPAGTFRVGAFGDSFTFGEGVQNDETWPKRLEYYLAVDKSPGSGGRRVEVLNFGIGKTGTSHQLAWYRKEGRLYGLDVVVVGLFANDVGDSWGGVYSLDGSTLVHNATAYSSVRRIQSIVLRIPFYSWSATHSHFFNLARAAATTYDDMRRTRQAQAAQVNGLVVPAANDQAQDAALEERKYQLTAALVDAFRSDVEGAGGHFLLMLIPQRGERPLTEYPASEAAQFVRHFDRLLKEAAGKGIDTYDLVPIFERQPDVETYYFPRDGNFNATGHDVVGRLLAEHLQPQLQAISARNQ